MEEGGIEEGESDGCWGVVAAAPLPVVLVEGSKAYLARICRALVRLLG
jgi:hypothetical protein